MMVQTKMLGRHRASNTQLRHFRIIGGKQFRMLTESVQDYCSQCGQRFDQRACGPTHALIFAERTLL